MPEVCSMNRRQKLFLIALAVTFSLVVSSLTLAALMDTSEEDHRLKVVTTFYPLAYLTGEIGGDRISLKTLIPQNTEVHAWEPSTSDILDVDQAALVVYHGAGLDPWFEDEILPAVRTDDKLVVETTLGADLIPAGDGYDPHTWLSPRMALPQASRIHDALCAVDPLNASFFDDRYGSLRDRLESLDEEYVQLLSGKTRSDIFVGHSAYGYLAEAYGFEQHGIVGLTADESPSTTTIASLVELMVDYDIYSVFVDPLYPDDYATTLRDSLEEQTGLTVDLLPLHLLVGESDGLDYIAQMEENLHNLAVGLEVTGVS